MYGQPLKMIITPPMQMGEKGSLSISPSFEIATAITKNVSLIL
jgi:hypothetical protein